MPLKIYLFFLILLFPTFHFYSQSSIAGNVYNENKIPLPGVLVVNINSDEQSFSDVNGHFSINGTSGNELRFVRQNYERKAIKINSQNFLFTVNVVMIFLPTEIEEVKLGPKLSGDLTKDSKALTKVDRMAQLQKDIGLPKPIGKLREKPSETVNNILLPILAGQLNVQALYNVISGKARRQKRLYKYDDFQEKVEWLKSNLRPGFFQENKIKDNQVSAFLSYALRENNEIGVSARKKNIDKAEFLLLELVPKYLNLSK